MICKQQLKLPLFFFSEFLLIHPFIDGNGRMARLLFNFLLKDFIIIPVSLYRKTRSHYINILESRNNCHAFPKQISKLMTEVLECIMLTLSNYNYLSQ